MRKRTDRALTVAAGLLGYISTPSSWPQTLRELRGEFRLSNSELILPSAIALLQIGFAVMMFKFARESNGIVPTAFDTGFFSSVGFLFLVGGVLLAYAYRVTYIFECGTLRVVLPGGYLYGQHDLRTLQSVGRTRGKAVDFLTLRWQDRKHRILLPSSLVSALCTGAGI